MQSRSRSQSCRLENKSADKARQGAGLPKGANQETWETTGILTCKAAQILFLVQLVMSQWLLGQRRSLGASAAGLPVQRAVPRAQPPPPHRAHQYGEMVYWEAALLEAYERAEFNLR